MENSYIIHLHDFETFTRRLDNTVEEQKSPSGCREQTTLSMEQTKKIHLLKHFNEFYISPAEAQRIDAQLERERAVQETDEKDEEEEEQEKKKKSKKKKDKEPPVDFEDDEEGTPPLTTCITTNGGVKPPTTPAQPYTYS